MTGNPATFHVASTEGSGPSEVTIDVARRTAAVNGNAMSLTPTEVRILGALCAQPGRFVARDALAEAARPDGRRSRDTSFVSVYVCRLNARLTAEGAGRFIASRYKAGYAIEAGSVAGAPAVDAREAHHVHVLGSLEITPGTCSAAVAGRRVKAPHLALELLSILADARGEVLSDLRIMDALYAGRTRPRPRPDVVKMHVHQARKAVMQAGGHDPIRNVHGRGYAIRSPDRDT